MKKLTSIVALMLAVIITLASCQFPIVPPGQGNDEDEKMTYTRLVYAESSLALEDLGLIRNAIFQLGTSLNIMTESEVEAADGEIVFGDSSREITQKAIKAMEAQFEKDGAECGYVVYTDGKSVAVYWTDEDMKKTALNVFLDECVNGMKLDLEKGIVYHQGYTTKEFIQQKNWLAIEAEGCDAATLEALKTLNAAFNGSTYVEWMANLWDDDVGGFYYSSSARDNEPYLPDLESTNQLTNWLSSHGATGGLSRNDFLPHDMKVKIVKFVKDMQDPASGYFFHPQWPQGIDKLKTDRYGRDLSWATSLIASLTIDTDGDGVEEKQYPNYCAPSGDKCELHKDGGSCDYSKTTAYGSGSGFATACAASSVALTADINEGKRGAAEKLMRNTESKIAAVAVSDKPDYSSSAAFSAWLEAYSGGFDGMYAHSGAAHNINALQDEIISKGFGDEVVAFLDEMQAQIIDYQIASGEEPTYLWQGKVNLTASWGVLKYMPFYNDSSCGKKIELETALNMIKTCIKVIEQDLDLNAPPAGNDLMNQWSSISGIRSNIKKYYGEEGEQMAIDLVREKSVDLINQSIEKISYYKLQNGLYAYKFNHMTMTSIYGVPICPGAEECDVNASVMFASQYAGIFGGLGYKTVPLCTEIDGQNFLRIIENLDPIVKIPVPKGETIDFEDGIPTGVSYSVQTGDFAMNIAEDPSDPSNNTLFFKSGIAPVYGDAVKFKSTGTGGNCFVFETKIYFKDMGTADDGKDIFQVKIGNAYMLTIGYEGKNVYMGYRTSTGTGYYKANVASAAKKNDGWCKMRLELYLPEEDGDQLRVKYFLNDEYVTTDVGHHFGAEKGGTVNSSISEVTFTSRKGFNTEIYFDDCFYNLERKDYSEDDHEITDSRD